MTEYALILVSTVLVNNFVLVKFLGLCPFMGVSRKLETAMGMGLATTFVLTLSSVSSYLVNEYILVPLGVGYLRTVAGQAGGLMQGTVLVILFVGFLFAERLWFDVKLTSLMGGATGWLYPLWRPLLDGPLFGAFGPYAMDGSRTPRSEMSSRVARWANAPEQARLWQSAPVLRIRSKNRAAGFRCRGKEHLFSGSGDLKVLGENRFTDVSTSILSKKGLPPDLRYGNEV